MNITEEVNLIVDTIITFDNKEELSWMGTYKKILKELNMEDKVNDNYLLSGVVKEITKRGYDIVDKPFSLEKYK